MNIETGGRTPIARVTTDFDTIIAERFIPEPGMNRPHANHQYLEAPTGIQDPTKATLEAVVKRIGVISTIQLPNDPIQRGIKAVVEGETNRRIVISATARQIEGGTSLSRTDEVGFVLYPCFTDHVARLLSDALDLSLTWRQSQLS